MLKKYALGLILIFLFCEFADAQSFYRRNRKTGLTISGGLGSAVYHGDLIDPNLTFDLSGAIGAGVEFPVQGRLSARVNLMWYRISADDKTVESDGSPLTRNLSFRSNNIELSALGIFQITPNAPRPRTNLTTYAMAGIGGTYFTPKGELDGTFHNLRDLQTEGVDYSELALVIPIGVGLSYRINYDWSVGFEVAYRFTTTDYLDDVSTVYVDNASFTNPIAQQLADRGPEIGAPLRAAGDQRGEEGDNDGYLVAQVKVNYHLNQGLYYKRKRSKRSKLFRRR